MRGTAAAIALRGITFAWVCCQLAVCFMVSSPRLLQLRVSSRHHCLPTSFRTGASSVSKLRCNDDSVGDDEVSIGWKLKKDEDEELLPAGSMPCIPVPAAARLAVPGQLREVHMYDSSNLYVHSYAMKHTGGYYVQVLQDPEALAERKFRLCEYGTLCKIMGYRQGIHRNKFAERSDSVRASVLAVGRIQVGDVIQVEPCVAAKVIAAPYEYLDAVPEDAPAVTELESAFNACMQRIAELGPAKLAGSRFEDMLGMWTAPEIMAEMTEGSGLELEASDLKSIVDRICTSVSADGRRTKPGTPNSVGPTVPFLLPHPFQPGQRASLSVSASLALLSPEERAEMYGMPGSPAVLEQAAKRLKRVSAELETLAADAK